MEIKPTAAITVFVLAGMLFFAYYLSDLSEGEVVKSATSEFAEGNVEKARTLLFENKDQISPASYFLYEAYLLRAQGRLEESNKRLQEALTKASTGQESTSLKTEIYLNQAMNSYLLRDSEAIHEALERVKEEVGGGNGWIELFSGLEAYLRGEYGEALRYWGDLNVRRPLSSWMKSAFSSIFTPYFLSSLKVRAEIYEGNYVEARQQLDEEFRKAGDNQMETLNFLLGLTYLAEAKEKPPISATPYFKLAFNYFQRVPMQEPAYQFDRKKMLKEMHQAAEELIEKKMYAQIGFYLSALKEWNDQEAVESLLSKLVSNLKEGLATMSLAQVRALGGLLKRFLPEGIEKEYLAVMMEKRTLEALKFEEVSKAKVYWQIAEKLSLDPKELRERFSRAIVEQILIQIPEDNNDLSQTFGYIRLWQSLEKSKAQRLLLPEKLTEESQKLWKNKKEHSKALKVLLLAAVLLEEENSEVSSAMVQQTVDMMFQHADEDNDMDAFSKLFDVMRQLNIPYVENQVNKIKEELLQEAQTNLQEHRYLQALVRAKWVLKQDPENTLAVEVAANAAYGKSDYAEALEYFKKLEVINPETAQKIAISEFLAGNPAKGLQMLQNLKKNDTFGDDVFLRIAVGKLFQSDPKSTLKWLKRIQRQTPESEVVLMIANADLNQWQNVLDIYNTLPEEYRNNPAIRGVSVIANGKLKQFEVAEKQLKELLEQQIVPKVPEISPAIRPLWSERLEELTPQVTGGIYYFKIKNDPTTALVYLNQMRVTSPKQALLRAEVLLALERYSEALDVTKEIRFPDENSAYANRKLVKALPTLAKIDTQVGLYPEAVELYQKLVEISPERTEFLFPYAQALEKIKRYDLALKQLKILETREKLSEEIRFGLIKNLIFTGKMEEAHTRIKTWLQESPKPSLLVEIKILKLLTIIRDVNLSKKLYLEISENKTLKISEFEELIDFLIMTGNYERAAELIGKNQDVLKQTPSGLVLLARFNWGLSKRDLAIDYAKQALIMDRFFMPARNFLFLYNRDPKWVKERVDLLRELIEVDKESVSIKIGYFEESLKYADIFLDEKNEETTITSFDLYSMTTRLQGLSNQEKELPEVFFLLGQGYFLMKKYPEARNSLKKALSLAIAYPEAARLLSELEVEAGNPSEAIEAALLGLKFDQDNVDLWLILAMANRAQGNVVDAVEALKNVIRYRPNLPIPYIGLGKLYIEISNPEGARRAFEHAAKLLPKNEEVLSLLLYTLHNPLLRIEVSDTEKLEQRQREVYDKLSEINAERANETLEKAKQRNLY